MKRILSLVLILAMSLCLFAGCTDKPATTGATEGNGLADAATYLYAMYKDNDGSITRRDFKRVAVVMIGDVKYDVEWSSNSADVTIGAVENSQVTIDINEEPAEDVTYTLTATIKDANGNTKTVTFTHYIEAPKASGTEFVKVPEVGTAYKFALQQNKLGQTLYFTGEMSGYYLAMSTNPFEAVDVYVEDVDGGQRIYFMKGEVKTYIDIVPRGEDQPGKVNVVLTETPTAVYTWDAERKTYTAKVEENTWYLGTYNEYSTISASNVTYIEDVSKIGDSQFPAGFCTVNIAPSQVAAPAVNTAYKFALIQNKLGQTLYFTGEMSGYYLAMSQNPAEGVNIFIENVDGGQRIYFMKGEVKTYIDIVPRGEDQPGKVNVVLTEDPTAVYTWDAERKTYTAKVEENTWYLGTYNEYNTISASNVTYIEDVSKIGDSQFPAGPYIVDGFMEMQPEFGETENPVEPEPEKPETPATLAEQIAEAAKLANKEYLPYESTITGTIIDEPTVGKYNATEFKFTVSDGTNTLLCYYVPVSGGTPAKGDTITVTGKLTAYNGTAQFDSTAAATLGEGGNTETPENPGTSDVTLQSGMKVVIYAPAYGKAISSVANGYNLSGVDVTVADGVVTGYGATEIWTVIVNADGTYSFECNGQKMGMQAEYASISMGAVNDTWEVISLGDGLYNIKNVVRGSFVDWYSGKWSTYTPADPATDPAFQLAFFIVE